MVHGGGTFLSSMNIHSSVQLFMMKSVFSLFVAKSLNGTRDVCGRRLMYSRVEMGRYWQLGSISLGKGIDLYSLI